MEQGRRWEPLDSKSLGAKLPSGSSACGFSETSGMPPLPGNKRSDSGVGQGRVQGSHITSARGGCTYDPPESSWATSSPHPPCLGADGAGPSPGESCSCARRLIGKQGQRLSKNSKGELNWNQVIQHHTPRARVLLPPHGVPSCAHDASCHSHHQNHHQMCPLTLPARVIGVEQQSSRSGLDEPIHALQFVLNNTFCHTTLS